MNDDTTDVTSEELLAELRATIAAQQVELDELRAQSAGILTSRRGLLRGAGVVGGLAALAGVTHAVTKPEAAEAIEGHNVKYAPNGLPVRALITASKQGVIQGEVTQKGQEGQIELIYFQHKGLSPSDAATGQATGKRSYDSVVIRKRVDKATPKLTTAFVTNENLTSVVVNFWKTNVDGTLSILYRITLTNARVSSQNWFSPDAFAGSAANAQSGGFLEELEFTFQAIEWEHIPTGTIASDSFDTAS